MKTPIVVFAFNRPDKLQALLTKLTRVPFQKAYVFCDGARGERDLEACASTQQVAMDFARRYPIDVIIRERNFGLSPNLVNGINMVLDQHPQMVMFEDDIHPKVGCLEYMELALNTYEHRSEIFSIGSYHRKVIHNY